jgi:glycosyltransferase involved in cell wall biosynthesis
LTTKIDKIAVASIQDPAEMISWSGIPAHICLALEDAGVQVVRVGPLEIKEPPFYRWFRSAYCRLGLKWSFAEVEPWVLRHQAAIVQSSLRRNTPQAVVSILPEPIAAKHAGVVTALVHDATFALLVDYYLMYSGLSKRSIRLGHKAYRKALKHASILIYASEWAARSAIRDYDADPAKVHIIEFGANLRDPPVKNEIADFVEQRLSAGEFRFLFLGADWPRKGGDDAIVLVGKLREMGIPVSLDVAGCSIQGHSDSRGFCIEHGFLDKRKSADREKLRRLLERASFLVVPSHAECFGCVYCEANAYGIPCIGRDTGGVSQVIRTGINGFLLSQDGRNLSEIAEQVATCLRHPGQYRKIAASSRDEFDQRLNWGRFAAETLRLLEAARA